MQFAIKFLRRKKNSLSFFKIRLDSSNDIFSCYTRHNNIGTWGVFSLKIRSNIYIYYIKYLVCRHYRRIVLYIYICIIHAFMYNNVHNSRDFQDIMSRNGRARFFVLIYILYCYRIAQQMVCTWMDVPGGVSLSSDLSFNPVPRDLAIGIPRKWFRQYGLVVPIYTYISLHTRGVMRSETETYKLHRGWV